VTILAVEGRVSHRTAADLERALAAASESTDRGVVVDFSGVDYISSAGLRALERASAHLTAAGRRLVVCALQDPVRAALTLAGLEAQIPTEPSRDLAQARVQRLD
jgi:anti-sigma B factor antagonist